jgi:hypothetical protein
MFFKFVETFFFLSLAITFALIITLVYHFKKRMENMETKSDTMFDIVQNLAKELLEFKQTNYEENPIISIPHQMEQVAYDTLDNVVNNNANGGHYGSDEEGYDEEGSDEEGSGEEGSGEEGSDEEGSDEEGSGEEGSDEEGSDEEEENVGTNVAINLLNEKITIPDYDDVSDVRVIELIEPHTQLSFPIDESLADETLDDSGFLDEYDSKPVELNTEDFLNVNKIIDETDIDMDTDADENIENNENNENHLSKSALRKLKIAELKRIATGKQITVDDAMTKNSIIDILLAN